MSQFKLKSINYVINTQNQAMFNVSYTVDVSRIQFNVNDREKLKNSIVTTTLFSETSEFKSMSHLYKNNTGSIYDINNKVVINDVYDVRDVKFKSSNKHTNDTNFSNLASDYLDNYCQQLSLDFLGMVQLDNYAYGLTYKSTQTPVLKTISFKQNYLYNYSLSTHQNDTFLYPTSNELDNQHLTYNEYLLNRGELSAQCLSNVFDPDKSMLNMQYNYMIEFPGSKQYSPYYDGVVLGDYLVCKNAYDPTYSMDVCISNSLSIDHCRDYVGIGHCGGKVFLKYRDNQNYSSQSQNVNFDGVKTNLNSSNVDSRNQCDIQVSSYSMTKRQPATYSYQHIEIIESINKMKNNMYHKSNLYSIELNNVGLNEYVLEDEVKQKIRDDVVHNIRYLAELVCPANTQLFNVYFTGM